MNRQKKKSLPTGRATPAPVPAPAPSAMDTAISSKPESDATVPYGSNDSAVASPSTSETLSTSRGPVSAIPPEKSLSSESTSPTSAQAPTPLSSTITGTSPESDSRLRYGDSDSATASPKRPKRGSTESGPVSAVPLNEDTILQPKAKGKEKSKGENLSHNGYRITEIKISPTASHTVNAENHSAMPHAQAGDTLITLSNLSGGVNLSDIPTSSNLQPVTNRLTFERAQN